MSDQTFAEFATQGEHPATVARRDAIAAAAESLLSEEMGAVLAEVYVETAPAFEQMLARLCWAYARRDADGIARAVRDLCRLLEGRAAAMAAAEYDDGVPE